MSEQEEAPQSTHDWLRRVVAHLDQDACVQMFAFGGHAIPGSGPDFAKFQAALTTLLSEAADLARVDAVRPLVDLSVPGDGPFELVHNEVEGVGLYDHGNDHISYLPGLTDGDMVAICAALNAVSRGSVAP